MEGRFPYVRDFISFCKETHRLSSTAGELHGMAENLEYVLSVWEMIQAVLMDAEDMDIRKDFVKSRVNERKQLAYEAEDVLDACEYELLRIQAEGVKTPERSLVNQSRKKGKSKERMEKDLEEVCKFPSSLLEIATFRDDVPKMMEKIKRVKEFEESRDSDEDAVKSKTDDEKELLPKISGSPILLDDHIIGRDDDMQILVQLLQSNDVGGQNPVIDGVHVIAVTGMAGLGKTTLVQHLYNDPEIRDHFGLKGWVCVGYGIVVDVVELLRDAIKSFTGDCCSLHMFDTCLQQMRIVVQGKKFLLVLDDVWDMGYILWETICSVLRAGAEGSKVLITTRNESVAAAMKAGKPYELKGLSDEDSWSLFKRCAFNDGEPTVPQDRLEEIKKKILKKCRGLPLALKALGRLLSHHRNNEKKWTEVLDSEMEDIKDGKDKILGSLMLSYLDLPGYLKPCFRFCAMYPKDYKISKDELLRLWMANDLIRVNYSEQPEDIGMGYIDELQSRGFLEHCGDFEDWDLTRDHLKMHGLIHDLAQHVSRVESTRVCHLLISPPRRFCENLNLRTLLAGEYDVSANILDIIGVSQCLRALSIKFVAPVVKDHLLSLKHLRFLSLSSISHIEYLESIPNLYNLQSLILKNCSILELPYSIGNLQRLRHLDIISCTSLTSILNLPSSLVDLNLRRCSSMTSISNLPSSLVKFHLGGCSLLTSIPNLPSSLMEMYLDKCISLTSIPNLPSSLVELNLRRCSSMTTIPNFPSSLKKLDFRR